MAMDFLIRHVGCSSGVASTILLEDVDESEAINKTREIVNSKAQEITNREKKDSLVGLFKPDGHLICAWTVTKSGKLRCEPVEIIRHQFDVGRIKMDYENTKMQVIERKRQKSAQ
jgi:hypothetical protein